MTAAERIRAALYDAAIVRLTASWYRTVLDQLAEGCRLLDVGIGTGTALLSHAELIVRKDLRITGVDINAAYIARCRRGIARQRLGDRIDVRVESIDAHRGGPYDAAYFSGSFMLLPDPPATLRRVGPLLVPGGRVYFTQTFERNRSPAVELVKPLLRFLTTIDFGRVTYEADFRRALTDGGMKLERLEPLDAGRRRSAALAVAHVAAGTTA